jgi:hypothetical protein
VDQGIARSKSNIIDIYQWVLTLLEVLNPTSFICAFTEPFLTGKIKYDFFQIQNIGIYFTGAQNEPCINITVFKEQNHQNMIFTQKQKHNIYCKSV